jgi:hypothetical protein
MYWIITFPKLTSTSKVMVPFGSASGLPVISTLLKEVETSGWTEKRLGTRRVV